MKKVFCAIVLFDLLATGVLFAAQQAKPQPPTEPTATVKTAMPSGPAKDALYAAIHRKDKADKAISDFALQVQKAQEQINAQGKKLQQDQVDAQKALEEARAQAFVAMKLDPNENTLDDDAVFSSNPKPAGSVEPKKK